MAAWLAPAIIGGATIAAGAIGSMSGRKSAKEMKKLMEQMIAMRREAAGLYDPITPPTPEEQYVAMQDLIQQGLVTPEMAEAYLLDETAMAGIDTDTEGRQAEYEALAELRDIVGSGGLTASDRAKIQEIQDELNTSARGARGAITQNMAERGISGSGLEYMEKLMAQQSGAETAARQGMDVAAQAEQRALEAIMAQAGLGGQLSQQEFSEQSDIAKAKDMIAQFNLANRQDIQMQNIAARNAAQATNLGEKQRIADYNIQQKNLEELRRADLKQKYFENEMAKATAKANALVGAGSVPSYSDNSSDIYGNLIGVGGQIIGSTAPYWGNNQTKTPTTQKYAYTSGWGKTPVAPDDYWKSAAARG